MKNKNDRMRIIETEASNSRPVSSNGRRKFSRLFLFLICPHPSDPWNPLSLLLLSFLWVFIPPDEEGSENEIRKSPMDNSHPIYPYPLLSLDAGFYKKNGDLSSRPAKK
jgi:hypothetical protein